MGGTQERTDFGRVGSSCLQGLRLDLGEQKGSLPCSLLRTGQDCARRGVAEPPGAEEASPALSSRLPDKNKRRASSLPTRRCPFGRRARMHTHTPQTHSGDRLGLLPSSFVRLVIDPTGMSY